jgi:hypothetical protein
MVDVFLCERERMWIFAKSVAKGMVIVERKMGIGALGINFSVLASKHTVCVAFQSNLLPLLITSQKRFGIVPPCEYLK